MPRGFPPDYLDQVAAILTAWEGIDPNLKVGDTTLTQTQEKVTAGRVADAKVADLTIQRATAVDERDLIFAEVNDTVTWLRSLVKGNFGPDSPQYAQVGGTRASERKARAKKGKT
jgi:hypothetical protein